MIPSPDADERDHCRFLDRVDEEAEAVWKKIGLAENVERWAAWRKGEARDRQGRAAPESLFRANLLGNYLERKNAGLTQSKPDMAVHGRGDVTLAEPAQVLTKVIRAILDEQQFDATLDPASDLAGTFGHVGFHTAWDPYADYNEGNITVGRVDPRMLRVDYRVKDVADLSRRAQYLTEDVDLPLTDIQATWPGRGGAVRPDPSLSTYQPARADGVVGKFLGAVGLPRPLLPQGGRSDGPIPYARIRRYWLRDPQRDPDDPKRRLFPRGRVIHRPVGQSLILDDQPNPYWDGDFPYDVWDYRCDFDGYWGRSDIEEGRKLQEAFGLAGNAIFKNFLLNSAATVIGDYNALTNQAWKDFDSRAARVVRISPGRRFEITPPPPIQDSHLRLVADILPGLLQTVFGVPEVSQGIRQKGVMAQSAVEGLQTAAETLVRQVARRLESVIERIGQKLVSRVIQYYTADRVMSMLGPGPAWEQYTFVRAKLLVPEDDEARQRFFTNFRFKIHPMSSLAINKIQRALMMSQLHAQGLVSGKAVLRVSEVPDWEKEYDEAQQEIQKKVQMGIPLDGGKKTRSNRRGTQLGMGG